MKKEAGNVMLALWGKTDPFHPLVCHLLDAGQVARALLESTAFAGALDKLKPALALSDERLTVPWVSYLVSLHDIGKCHADFQGKGPQDLLAPLGKAGIDCAPQASGFRHEAFGGEWVRDFLRTERGLDQSSARTIGAVVAAHHGDYRPGDFMPETPSRERVWGSLRKEVEHLLRQMFRPGPSPPSFSDQSLVGLLLVGLVVLSDWVASNRELFPSVWGGGDLVAYAERSLGIARAAVQRLGFCGIPLPTGTFSEVWKASGYAPRPIQSACEAVAQARPGLCLIEAPMGEGKTEAALYLASQWGANVGLGGLYVGLPTAATSNQMYGRVSEFLGSHDLTAAAKARLVHGMAWLLDDATPETSPNLESGDEERLALDWFRPKKRALLAPYGVGTVDQALMSVLYVRHGFLRLFGLAGKVLIVDEVHAYDAYMTEILTLLLRWCASLRVPVILLSATLPVSRRKALADAYAPGVAGLLGTGSVSADAYPLLTLVSPEGDVSERSVPASSRSLQVEVLRHPGLLGRPEATADLVAERVRATGGCHAIIVNTVRGAQAVYRSLRARLEEVGAGEVRLLLFHSRFAAERRQEIEALTLAWFDRRSLLPEGHEERTERPTAAVLVATQVVEQSLDLDFDELFTEIAPVDLLLQRAGRLHRHERGERPTGKEARLHLLLPEEESTEFGPTERVYDRYVLLRTLVCLAGKERWELPADVRPLVDAVYEAPDTVSPSASVTEADLRVAHDAWDQRREREGKKAEKYLIPGPSPTRFKLTDPLPEGPFDEDESSAASYFAARTRLGDDGLRVILVEEGGCEIDLASGKAPGRARLQELLRGSVSLPQWWIPTQGLTPEKGFSPLAPAPKWLSGHSVLRLRDGRWEGRLDTDRRVVIRNDPELGVLREEGDT